jgi:hypothetical protein
MEASDWIDQMGSLSHNEENRMSFKERYLKVRARRIILNQRIDHAMHLIREMEREYWRLSEEEERLQSRLGPRKV